MPKKKKKKREDKDKEKGSARITISRGNIHVLDALSHIP
jgi:hypothetical protein